MMAENNIENQSDKNLIASLENLGCLPNRFHGGFLFNLLEHKKPKISFLAAKNIAKLKADPTEGDDSALYKAMGYVRKSDRKSGLTRKKNEPQK